MHSGWNLRLKDIFYIADRDLVQESRMFTPVDVTIHRASMIML